VKKVQRAAANSQKSKNAFTNYVAAVAFFAKAKRKSVQKENKIHANANVNVKRRAK